MSNSDCIIPEEAAVADIEARGEALVEDTMKNVMQAWSE